MSLKYILIACLVSAVGGGAVTKYYFPTTKTVETEKEVVHNNIVTVTHTLKEKDGTVDVTTTTTDHSQITDNKTDTQVLAPAPKNWLVSGTYSTDIHTLQPAYGVEVNRRILGPMYIGALLNSKGSIGLSLGFEF